MTVIKIAILKQNFSDWISSIESQSSKCLFGHRFSVVKLFFKIAKAKFVFALFLWSKSGQFDNNLVSVQRQCPMAILFTILAAACTIYLNLQTFLKAQKFAHIFLLHISYSFSFHLLLSNITGRPNLYVHKWRAVKSNKIKWMEWIRLQKCASLPIQDARD